MTQESPNIFIHDPFVGVYPIPLRLISSHHENYEAIRCYPLCVEHYGAPCDNPRCMKIHADVYYVDLMRTMRSLWRDPMMHCCVYHGDQGLSYDFCNLLFPKTGRNVFITHKQWIIDVPAVRLCRTHRLETLLNIIQFQNTNTLCLNADQVCYEHHFEYCLYGEFCKRIHVCRQWWASVIGQNEWVLNLMIRRDKFDDSFSLPDIESFSPPPVNIPKFLTSLSGDTIQFGINRIDDTPTSSQPLQSNRSGRKAKTEIPTSISLESLMFSSNRPDLEEKERCLASWRDQGVLSNQEYKEALSKITKKKKSPKT